MASTAWAARMMDCARRLVRAWRETAPWLHWLAFYACFLLYFLGSRLVALPATLTMYMAKSEHTPARKTAGVLLGMVEDAILTSLAIAVLLACECVGRCFASRCRARARDGKANDLDATSTDAAAPSRIRRVAGLAPRFLLAFVMTALVLAPFAADLLLIRTRQMRFTTDLLVMYNRDRAQASSFEIDSYEVRLAKETIAGTALFALGFAVFYTCCIDLTRVFQRDQRPGQAEAEDGAPATSKASPSEAAEDFAHTYQSLEDGGSANSATDTASHMALDEPYALAQESGDAAPTRAHRAPCCFRFRCCGARARIAAIVSVASVAVVVLTMVVTHAVAPSMAALALNTTLNELCRGVFRIQFQPGPLTGELRSAAFFLEPETEEFSLFAKDALYRRTTAFKGPLAFDVKIDAADPPNVIVVVVESFRYLDSLYLARNTSAAALMQKHNVTMTPNFDRWATRGVAFSNMWSSWQTSRSIESVLFAQVPFDSITETGTTYGRKDTALAGLPQLFKQKQYETAFTSGSDLDYDQWYEFLGSHGFDKVLGAVEMKALAETHLGIKAADWSNEQGRAYLWGVHDDVSFELLGDLLVNKTAQQAARVRAGQPKTPLFLTHYTISSHTPFESRPAWFANVTLPDFSPLYKDQPEADVIKRYAEMRYFTDLMLGKFLERMEASGVLEDSIVVIVGDHGQNPETGMGSPYSRQVPATHVAGALLAEGRLGKWAGTIMDDATEQYDLLNTLADVVGVPAGGFLQTGVGRSLKRRVPFGQRMVWSNNPLYKMAVVRGHERLVYDKISDETTLQDAHADVLAERDLFPALPQARKEELRRLRDAGRELTAYFRRRWKRKCFLQAKCE